MPASKDFPPGFGGDDDRTLAVGSDRPGATDATMRIGGSPLGRPSPASGSETVVLGGPAPSFAWLVIRRGPRAGRIFTLDPSGSTIGRDPMCDILLDDESISRQHAKVRVEKEGDKETFFIWDLASRNGTFVNGEQVVKHPLHDGDEVKVGEQILIFKQV